MEVPLTYQTGVRSMSSWPSLWPILGGQDGVIDRSLTTMPNQEGSNLGNAAGAKDARISAGLGYQEQRQPEEELEQDDSQWEQDTFGDDEEEENLPPSILRLETPFRESVEKDMDEFFAEFERDRGHNNIDAKTRTNSAGVSSADDEDQGLQEKLDVEATGDSAGIEEDLEGDEFLIDGNDEANPEDHSQGAIIPRKGYLMYLPHSGFTNQLSEFENAAVIAALLNRTLIVPPIYLGTFFFNSKCLC